MNKKFNIKKLHAIFLCCLFGLLHINFNICASEDLILEQSQSLIPYSTELKLNKIIQLNALFQYLGLKEKNFIKYLELKNSESMKDIDSIFYTKELETILNNCDNKGALKEYIKKVEGSLINYIDKSNYSVDQLNSKLSLYITFFAPSTLYNKNVYRQLSFILHPDKAKKEIKPLDTFYNNLTEIYQTYENSKNKEKDLINYRMSKFLHSHFNGLKYNDILIKNLSLYKKYDLKIKELIDEDEILNNRANEIEFFIDTNIKNLKNNLINWQDFRLHLAEFLYLHSHIKREEIHTLNDICTINTKKLDSIKDSLESHKELIDSLEHNELITTKLKEITETIDILNTFKDDFKNGAIQLTVTRSQLLSQVKHYLAEINTLKEERDPKIKYNPLNSDSVFRKGFNKKFNLNDVATEVLQELQKPKPSPKNAIYRSLISPTLQTFGYLERTNNLHSRTLKNIQKNYTQLHNWLIHI